VLGRLWVSLPGVRPIISTTRPLWKRHSPAKADHNSSSSGCLAPRHGKRIWVIAGKLKANPEQGALQVWDELYLTPTRSGRARMVQADALVLTVRTASGDFFSFDVATRQWGAPQPTATPRPLEDYPQGMVACEDPLTTFLLGNCWTLLNGNRYYHLRAGASQDEPLQGYLIITCENIQPGGAVCERRRYNTPSQVGRVEIIAADGAVLTLRAEDGSFFGFDLKDREWVISPATPTPGSTRSFGCCACAQQVAGLLYSTAGQGKDLELRRPA